MFGRNAEVAGADSGAGSEGKRDLSPGGHVTFGALSFPVPGGYGTVEAAGYVSPLPAAKCAVRL